MHEMLIHLMELSTLKKALKIDFGDVLVHHRTNSMLWHRINASGMHQGE
jgi:hypothetical protein